MRGEMQRQNTLCVFTIFVLLFYSASGQTKNSQKPDNGDGFVAQKELGGLEFGQVIELWRDNIELIRIEYMESDMTSADKFIVSYGLGIGTIDPRIDLFTNICGDLRSNGYKEGACKDAQFELVTSLTQINGSMLIVVDETNNCIRLIDRDNSRTTTLAGKCENVLENIVPRDGSFEDARFNVPQTIIEGDAPQEYFILDTGKLALRKLSIKTETVTTLYQDSLNEVGVVLTASMVRKDSTVYIASGDRVLVISIETGLLHKIKTSDYNLADGKIGTEVTFHSLLGIQLLSNGQFAVLDFNWPDQHYVYLIDATKKEIDSFNLTPLLPSGEINPTCFYHQPLEKKIFIGTDYGIFMLAYRGLENDENGGAVTEKHVNSAVQVKISIASICITLLIGVAA